MIGKVEKIINGGWGIIRDSNKTVFLNYVLPGEEVEYSIKDKAKGIYWGETLNILSPSPYRKTPECSLFGECGGCVFQHIDYEYQKQIKTDIFIDDMKRIGSMNIKPDIFYKSPTYGYRIRGRLKANESGKIGFIKKGTHTILQIDNCLLFSDEMNNYLLDWNKQKNPPFFYQQDISYIENHDKNIHSYLSHSPKNDQKTILDNFKNTIYSWKENSNSFVKLKIKDFEYRIKPSTFFQVNKYQFENMLNFVEDNLFKTEKAIDLYSGVGFFVPLLLKYSKNVIAVESFTESINLAEQSFPDAKFVNTSVDKFNFVKSDIIIADPPRSGLSKYVIGNIIRLKYKRLIYISCSSATFARDAKILKKNGYSIKKLALIDLFPQTPHIEIMSVFEKS